MLHKFRHLIIWLILISGLTHVAAQLKKLPSDIKSLIEQNPFSDSSYQKLLAYLDTTKVSNVVRLHWLEEIIHHFDEGKQTEFQARSWQLLGSYLIDEGEYGDATKSLLEGLRLAEENGHILVESLCHNGLAIIDYYRSQFKGANYHWNIVEKNQMLPV